jgi:hypothetical protein
MTGFCRDLKCAVRMLLQRVDPGYRPDHVLICQIALPETQYGSKDARLAFFRTLLERVRGLPGVVSASAVNAPPLGGHWGNCFTIEAAPPQGPNEPLSAVLQGIAFPGYLETMGIPLVAGLAGGPGGPDAGAPVRVILPGFMNLKPNLPTVACL